MTKITDEQAEILISNFQNNTLTTAQEDKGNGKVVSIGKGVCVVEFENGDFEKYENPFFFRKYNIKP